MTDANSNNGTPAGLADTPAGPTGAPSKSGIPGWVKVVGFCIASFAMYFLIGFLTRQFARMVPHIYGFHAILAALFFACLTYVLLRRRLGVLAYFMGFAGLAALLGMMSPVMGWALGTTCVVGLIAWFAASFAADKQSAKPATAASVLVGALFYPVTIVVGMLVGHESWAYASGGTARFVPLLVAGCALAVLGMLLGRLIDKVIARKSGKAPSADGTPRAQA